MGRGIIFGLLAGAFWGAVFIVPVLLPDFSPLELMVGRYVCYGALAAGLMLPRAWWPFSKKQRSHFFG